MQPRTLRRIFAGFFLTAFIVLSAAMGTKYVKTYPATIFLELDPLHGLATTLATFQGLIEDCIAEDGTISLTDECLQPEEVSLLLDTLNANAFNFFLANVVPGVHHIEVEAKAETDGELFGTRNGDYDAEAFVGLGAMHVDETRLIKGADGISEL